MKIHEIINKDNWCQKILYVTKPEFENDDINSGSMKDKCCKFCLAGFCYIVTNSLGAAENLMRKIAKEIAPSSDSKDSLKVLANFNDSSDFEIIQELCKELDV